jgi:urate oxidase
MAELSYARYGKDNIRLYKVSRDPSTGVQSVSELTVCVLLEGDIETS